MKKMAFLVANMLTLICFFSCKSKMESEVDDGRAGVNSGISDYRYPSSTPSPSSSPNKPKKKVNPITHAETTGSAAGEN